MADEKHAPTLTAGEPVHAPRYLEADESNGSFVNARDFTDASRVAVPAAIAVNGNGGDSDGPSREASSGKEDSEDDEKELNMNSITIVDDRRVQPVRHEPLNSQIGTNTRTSQHYVGRAPSPPLQPLASATAVAIPSPPAIVTIAPTRTPRRHRSRSQSSRNSRRSSRQHDYDDGRMRSDDSPLATTARKKKSPACCSARCCCCKCAPSRTCQVCVEDTATALRRHMVFILLVVVIILTVLVGYLWRAFDTLQVQTDPASIAYCVSTNGTRIDDPLAIICHF